MSRALHSVSPTLPGLLRSGTAQDPLLGVGLRWIIPCGRGLCREGKQLDAEEA